MNTNTLRKIVTDEEAHVALLAFQENMRENNGMLMEGYEEVNHTGPIKSRLSKLLSGMSDKLGGVVFAGAVGMAFIVATKFL